MKFRKQDLAHDLFLPVLLFMALGGMVWGVRGSSGFGAMQGCIFAGVTWGTAWWYIAYDPSESQLRRYSSSWIILALTVGIGISGNRGWMQWPSFFDGQLLTNYAAGKSVPIPRIYGFIWLFIAGVPWAGIGACLLAWCHPQKRATIKSWILRLTCGFGGAIVAQLLFDHMPEVFLPLYESMKAQYADLTANPNLRRLINDNRAAIIHLGFYIGCLFYEIGRRDWKNVVLILTVGFVSGLGWALWQNWRWAPRVWPQAHFNWWRCWESCGGISIGLAYGIAYFLVNQKATEAQKTCDFTQSIGCHPNLDRLALYLGLLFGLGLSIRNGLKGWANIYLGNEKYWEQLLTSIVSPVLLLCTIGLVILIWRKPVTSGVPVILFPQPHRFIWGVLIIQNIISQMVTGPRREWSEMVFSLYYILLFLISSVIIYHFQCIKIKKINSNSAVENRSNSATT